MTTARDIMTSDATCISVNDSLQDAARKMADLDVGALPICGDDDGHDLIGMVSQADVARTLTERAGSTLPSVTRG